MDHRIHAHERFHGVYWVELENGRKKLATINSVRGHQVYGEQLVEHKGVQYRIWDPYRSKLAAAILKGLKCLPIGEGTQVLYLGAASGTTSSHISDIVGARGRMYCVEISPRPLRDLLQVCSRRPNMIPILGDARRPLEYSALVKSVDVIYQDIAQPDQTDIMLLNVRTFLKDGGYGMVSIKARSIDVTRDPAEVFRKETEKLEKKTEVLDIVRLEPYEKDHAMVVIKK